MACVLAVITCWPPWVWIPREISMFWDSAKAPARTRWWSRNCWRIWWRAGSGRGVADSLSSMAADQDRAGRQGAQEPEVGIAFCHVDPVAIDQAVTPSFEAKSTSTNSTPIAIGNLGVVGRLVDLNKASFTAKLVEHPTGHSFIGRRSCRGALGELACQTKDALDLVHAAIEVEASNGREMDFPVQHTPYRIASS